MTLELLSPGVYIQELPSGSNTIAGVATSITAFVGYLTRGPATVAVQLQNFGDFQRIFGGVDEASETSYQVNQFFLNGGSTAWVARVFNSSPAAQPLNPSATLEGLFPSSKSPAAGAGLAAPVGDNTLEVNAANPGSWGTNVYVTVDPLTTVNNGFNLTATEYDFTSTTPSVVKTTALSGVVMDPTRSNYVVQALKNSGDPLSALITLNDLNQKPPPAPLQPAGPPPFATGTILTFTPPTPPQPPATGLTITLTVQGPPTTPPGGGKPVTWVLKLPAISTPIPVQSVNDMIAALQNVLSQAIAQCPLLASARVNLTPQPPPSPGTVAPPATTRQLQVVLTNPNYAGYLIGVVCSNKTLLTANSTNVQAYQLADTTTQTSAKDGLPPSGADLVGSQSTHSGIYELEDVELFNILCLPDLRLMGGGDYLIAATSALNYCVSRRAMAILDIPTALGDVHSAQTWISQTVPSFGPGVINAASYYPELVIPDPENNAQPRKIGVSGTAAGIFAATDQSRGVWKAPAGIEAGLAGVMQLTSKLSDSDNGLINPYGLNALRTFTGYGNIVWGARTLAAGNEADQDWKYVPVRRLALFIEQSLVNGLQWAVFEPNDESLWAQMRVSVSSFMQQLFTQGAFAGMTPDTAYQVICDASTTTAADMENGIVNILVMFAPADPAEFVVISIKQMVGQSSS